MVWGAKLFDLETGAELTAASKTITMGDTKTFDQMDMQPVFYSTWLDYECSWSSSDTTVARMSAEGDGIVGVSPGTATITGTITSAGLQGSCSFTVTVQPLPDGIYYLKTPSNLKVAAVNASAPCSGCLVTLMHATTYSTYLWKFERQSDGYYIIRSLADSAYYMTAPSAESSNGQVTLQSGTLTDTKKWALSVTESGRFKLIPKSSIGLSNEYVLNSQFKVMQCEGDDSQDGMYSDEWIIRKNIVYFIEHYYDRGVNIRYCEQTVGYTALDVIKEAEQKFIKMMDDHFGITVISAYRLITSVADECKMSQSSENAVAFESLDDVCTHENDCLTTDKLHEEIIVSPQAEVGRVIWTGHALTGNPSSTALPNSKTTVITLKKNSDEKSDGTIVYKTNFAVVVGNYANTLRHELGHLLSLADHYCYKTDHGRENCHDYCDLCVKNRDHVRVHCIMTKNEESQFCRECCETIEEYLTALDNEVGE